MYIKVVELDEHYLLTKDHFLIYFISFEKNDNYNVYYIKCIKMYGKNIRNIFQFIFSK